MADDAGREVRTYRLHRATQGAGPGSLSDAGVRGFFEFER